MRASEGRPSAPKRANIEKSHGVFEGGSRRHKENPISAHFQFGNYTSQKGKRRPEHLRREALQQNYLIASCI
jgi:hypothetical protein